MKRQFVWSLFSKLVVFDLYMNIPQTETAICFVESPQYPCLEQERRQKLRAAYGNLSLTNICAGCFEASLELLDKVFPFSMPHTWYDARERTVTLNEMDQWKGTFGTNPPV